MASTFTDNTGIEKIGDGDQSGLWGQTTNLNFDIIDRALNGSTSITLAGTTHTLTTASGALSDGQFSVIVFTGSLGAPNTVTVAPNTAQKLYWIRNSTNQNVIISQGSGSNVTIPAGATKAVFTDGGGASAAVTDLTAVFTGNLVGNVTGNVTGNLTGDVTGNLTGNVTGNVTGDLTGNAATATKWQTARTITINGVAQSVDGTADVTFNLPSVTVNDGTLTLATSGIATGSQTFTANQSTSATFTVNVPGTNLAATPGTTAGPIITSSTGASVTIPSAGASASGVVTTGTQTFAGAKTFTSTIGGSINGNAATATAWQTGRTLTINGVPRSVNGTADVTFTGAEVGAVPSGGIIMWSGSPTNVPAGWLLCNGANGTPDLRDRFIVGAGGSYGTGATGGANTVSLNASQLPSHSHTFSGTTSTNGDHSHLYYWTGAGGPLNVPDVDQLAGVNFAASGPTSVAGAHNHTFSGTTGATGSGAAIENRPPYYALAYIMKA